MLELSERIAKRRLGVSVLVPALLLVVLWLTYILAIYTEGGSFYWLGIYPRTVGGLVGVLLSPFIHADFEHALSNSIALGLLGVALFYFYPREALQVLLLGWLFSGVLTWLIARPSYHIGASGLIYVFGTYLIFRGWRVRRKALAALSLLVTFSYGSMVWGIFPNEVSISWEGHLSGALVGIVLAFWQKVESNEKLPAFGSSSAYDFSTCSHTGLPQWKFHYKSSNARS